MIAAHLSPNDDSWLKAMTRRAGAGSDGLTPESETMERQESAKATCTFVRSFFLRGHLLAWLPTYLPTSLITYLPTQISTRHPCDCCFAMDGEIDQLNTLRYRSCNHRHLPHHRLADMVRQSAQQVVFCIQGGKEQR